MRIHDERPPVSVGLRDGQYGASDCLVARVGNYDGIPSAAARLHTAVLTGAVYANGLESGGITAIFSDADPSGQSALLHVEETLRRMQPRDPAEEMLVSQLVLLHLRVLALTRLACKATTLEEIGSLNEYADRASNTYRRLMLGLADYRRPPRAGDSFTAIRQANIAQQQVVQNVQHEGKATNEQGGAGAGVASKAPVPTKPRRARISPGHSKEGSALDEIHGTKNRGRQGAVPMERLEARRQVRRGGPPPA